MNVDLEMDAGVRKVVEFMQRELPANDLRGIAAAVAAVGEVVWDTYEYRQVSPLTLREPPIRLT